MNRLLWITAALLCISCGINRTENGERKGLWIEKNKVGANVYKSRGRYRNGFERKTWKYYQDGKLVKKEVYKDSICFVTHFRNKKKILEGTTKMRVEGKDLHWFYTGNWREYDTVGNLIAVRNYEDGELIDETDLNIGK